MAGEQPDPSDKPDRDTASLPPIDADVDLTIPDLPPPVQADVTEDMNTDDLSGDLELEEADLAGLPPEPSSELSAEPSVAPPADDLPSAEIEEPELTFATIAARAAIARASVDRLSTDMDSGDVVVPRSVDMLNESRGVRPYTDVKDVPEWTKPIKKKIWIPWGRLMVIVFAIIDCIVVVKLRDWAMEASEQHLSGVQSAAPGTMSAIGVLWRAVSAIALGLVILLSQLTALLLYYFRRY